MFSWPPTHGFDAERWRPIRGAMVMLSASYALLSTKLADTFGGLLWRPQDRYELLAPFCRPDFREPHLGASLGAWGINVHLQTDRCELPCPQENWELRKNEEGGAFATVRPRWRHPPKQTCIWNVAPNRSSSLGGLASLVYRNTVLEVGNKRTVRVVFFDVMNTH